MKHRYSTIAATACLTLLLIALSSNTGQTFPAQTYSKAPPQSFLVVSATLTSSPEVYDGQCPVTFKFSGNITVKGKGQVRYTFVRSDGATAPVYTLDFNGEGTKPVDTTWTLSAPTFGEWLAIKILSPNELQSDPAAFKGTCLKPTPSTEQTFPTSTFAKAPEQSLQVISATLTASPEAYDGQCPVTIKFSGNITIKGRGTVKYTFERSDGASGPAYAMEFKEAGTQAVSTEWTLGDASALPHFEGWLAIKILSPNELQSDRAAFKGTCFKPAPSTGEQASVAPGAARQARRLGPVADTPGSNWDFEEGLAGWTPTGDAFTSQPTLGDNVVAARVRMDMTLERGGIGGDYWKRVPYPIGHHLDAWVGTYENHPDAAAPLGVEAGDGRTGTLTSGDFPLDDAHRFIAFVVGGGSDVATERVELQVRGENDAEVAEIERIVGGNRAAAVALGRLFGGTAQGAANGVGSRDGDYVIALTSSGQNSEVMRPVVFEVPRTLRGRHGRIRIVDNSSGSWGHINADDFRFGAARPPDRSTRVWGFADTHAHPMNDLAFGGNFIQGSLYARDGSAYGSDRYRRTALPTMFDSVGRPQLGPLGTLLTAIGHGPILDSTRLIRSGYPELQGYPTTSQMAGQTVYSEWVRRAYDGGLRLMSALAVNTWVISSHPIKRAVLPSSQPEDDRRSADVQVADIKAWAALPEIRTWVEVAFTPADARRIIGSNKLAIVIGIELDSLGNFVPNDHFVTEPRAVVMPADATEQRRLIAAEVDHLYAEGVRQIGPFHYVSGVWGGAAMSQLLFNEVNRKVTGSNVVVVSGAAQGIRYRLDMDWGLGGVAGRTLLTGDGPGMQNDHPSWESTRLGHINIMGLLPAGTILFEEMTRRGLLIDVDHASHRSVEGLLALARERNYPLLSSHSDYIDLGFTDLGFTGPGDFTYRGLVYDDNANLRHFDTTIQDPLRNERMITGTSVRTISELGGITGAIMWLPRRTSWGDAVPNDCDGSSKTWAQAYQYAVEVTGNRGVALSTDRITVYPRFGPNAAFPLGLESTSMPRRDERRFRQVDAQHNGVRYDTPLREWGAYRFKLAGTSGAWEKTPIRDSSTSDSSTWESHPVEIGDAWMALAAWSAGRNPRTMRNHGIDGGNRVVDYAWGLGSTDPSDVYSDGVLQLSGTLHSRYAAYCVRNTKLPSDLRSLRFDLSVNQIWAEYWWVKRAWEQWQRMDGNNEPLSRYIFGYRDFGAERVSRDFDVNLDGVAHYGMIPDFLQDVANSHPRPAEVGAYFDPLFRSAESYIQMWEKAQARR